MSQSHLHIEQTRGKSKNPFDIHPRLHLLTTNNDSLSQSKILIGQYYALSINVSLGPLSKMKCIQLFSSNNYHDYLQRHGFLKKI